MVEVKMVVVNGVRYRPEHAPKVAEERPGGEVEHKMRKPRQTAKKQAAKKPAGK